MKPQKALCSWLPQWQSKGGAAHEHDTRTSYIYTSCHTRPRMGKTSPSLPLLHMAACMCVCMCAYVSVCPSYPSLHHVFGMTYHLYSAPFLYLHHRHCQSQDIIIIRVLYPSTPRAFHSKLKCHLFKHSYPDPSDRSPSPSERHPP